MGAVPTGIGFVHTGNLFLGAQSVIPGPNGVWTHIAVTWDGTTTKYYLNGSLSATAVSAGTIASCPTPVPGVLACHARREPAARRAGPRTGVPVLPEHVGRERPGRLPSFYRRKTAARERIE
jgi:hypothetical protein